MKNSIPTPTSWGSQDYPGAQSVMWASIAGILPGDQYPPQHPSTIRGSQQGLMADGWSVPQGGVLGLMQAHDLASSEAATQRGLGGVSAPSSRSSFSLSDVAAASGFFGARAARFASERTLGGANPSSTLAAINAQAADMVVRGDHVSALALLSEPRTVAAARATGHLNDLHKAIGVLLGTTPMTAPRGMGQDPYSAIIGAVATAVGQVAQAVPAGINAVNAPRIQKQAAQAQEIIAQAQAQAQADQSRAWADSLAKSAPYIGAGILGLGLVGLAVL